MTCLICKHGRTKRGRAVVTLQRQRCTIVCRDVPADICDNCGEYYLDSLTAKAVLSRAEDAASRDAEVEIVRFAA